MGVSGVEAEEQVISRRGGGRGRLGRNLEEQKLGRSSRDVGDSGYTGDAGDSGDGGDSKLGRNQQ